LAQLRRWWRPGRGTLFFAEAANQAGVGSIIFVAQQFALSESFNLGRVDDTYALALLVQIALTLHYRHRRFQTGVHLRNFLFPKPNRKFRKTFNWLANLRLRRFH
jgi:hypothetical protein